MAHIIDITAVAPDREIKTFTLQNNVKPNFCSDKRDFVNNNIDISVLPLMHIQDQLKRGELMELLPQPQ